MCKLETETTLVGIITLYSKCANVLVKTWLQNVENWKNGGPCRWVNDTILAASILNCHLKVDSLSPPQFIFCLYALVLPAGWAEWLGQAPVVWISQNKEADKNGTKSWIWGQKKMQNWYTWTVSNTICVISFFKENCQARVQVPNPLSQQAPNPDSKVRPSVKNPKTQFFGLGWHNNHMGQLLNMKIGSSVEEDNPAGAQSTSHSDRRHVSPGARCRIKSQEYCIKHKKYCRGPWDGCDKEDRITESV